MIEQSARDMASGRWKEVFAAFDAWGKDGKAGPEQVEAAKQSARDSITEGLLTRGKTALGSRAGGVARRGCPAGSRCVFGNECRS